jgi:hypothetical protein
MNRRKSLPQQLIELMIADSSRRRGLPVDVAKLRRDRALRSRLSWFLKKIMT